MAELAVTDGAGADGPTVLERPLEDGVPSWDVVPDDVPLSALAVRVLDADAAEGFRVEEVVGLR